MSDFAAARTAMVDCQIRPSDVTRFPIIEAMLEVPREAYVPPALRPVAYVGEHVELAPGRVLLDPRVLGKMLDALDIQPDESVLDVGCLHGYSTAVLARIGGRITGLEQDADMAMFAEANLSGNRVENAAVLRGELAQGARSAAPFDAILINGGIEEFPKALERQLREGGRAAAIFIDGPSGQARLGTRTAEGMVWRRAFDATAPVLPGFSKARVFQL
jgi:protein-L-isoaspartate(D-aspartate) O-methyltransferase